MRVIHIALPRYSFILGASLLLAACSPSNDTSTVVPQTPQSAAFHPALNNAKGKGAYLYISDAGAGVVQGYTWPKLKPVGTLTGFSEPQGLCSHADNLFVANTEGLDVVEYAGGGTSPVATVSDPDGFPAGCSVDPETGDLAVANIINASGNTPGNVVIFKNAKGTPKEFSNPQLSQVFSVQYDGSGNLFVSALSSAGTPVLAELPAGKNVIKVVCPKLDLGQFAGGLAWDGRYLVVAVSNDLERIQGCTVVGHIRIAASTEFMISGNRLITTDPGNADVFIYAYPKGGSPLQTLSGFSEPIGVTVVNDTKGSL
jgi:hypothetical protein